MKYYVDDDDDDDVNDYDHDNDNDDVFSAHTDHPS